MVRFLLQSRDISFNILWCTMVVVENRKNLVANAVPELSHSDVEREYAVKNRIEEDIDLVLDETSHT